MFTNKLSRGGLIGVHISSIVKWGYQDNFKLVYFLYEKILCPQKHVIRKNEVKKTKISKH